MWTFFMYFHILVGVKLVDLSAQLNCLKYQVPEFTPKKQMFVEFLLL